MSLETMSSGFVRKANAADIPAIWHMLWEESLKGNVLPRTPREIASVLPYFFVKETNGLLTGCACAEIYSPEMAEIRSVVSKNGGGKMLVHACIDEIKSFGIAETFVTTAKPGYFQKFGFEFQKGGKDVLWLRPFSQDSITRIPSYPYRIAGGVVRKAHAGDIDSVYRLIAAGAEKDLVLPWEYDKLEQSIDKFLVYDDEAGSVRGTVVYLPYGNRIGEVRSLVVDEAFRQQGIGLTLMHACLVDIRRSGIAQIFTTTDNLAFFGKFGFQYDKVGKYVLWLRDNSRKNAV